MIEILLDRRRRVIIVKKKKRNFGPKAGHK
jgi:hypothetical protein